MTPLTTKVPYDYLASFKKSCEGTGYDFEVVFDWHFFHGFIFKSPDYLLLGSLDPNRSDAWLVFWAEAHTSNGPLDNVKTFLKFVPYWLPYVGWARTLKGRKTVKYYSTTRLMKFINQSHEIS